MNNAKTIYNYNKILVKIRKKKNKTEEDEKFIEKIKQEREFLINLEVNNEDFGYYNED